MNQKKRGRYLVTIETSLGRQVRQADIVEFLKSKWGWKILPGGGNSKVIAWQKCPEPYQG